MIRALVLAALVLIVPAGRAHAQGGVEAARARYEQGDFPGALQALERAEQGTLTLDQLIAVHELRVLLHRAMGEEGEADRALRIIAALRPDHVLSDEVPPVLQERFRTFARASSGPPRVEVDVETTERIALRARIAGDDEHLVRATRLRARVAGGAWVEGGDALSVDAGEGQRVEWEAEAIGPAGAVLASARGEHVTPAPERGGDAWPWVALGGGVLVVGAVVVIAVVAASGVDTRVEGPVLAELRF